MRVAEMKVIAMNQLVQLESEKSVIALLTYLETLAKEEKDNRREKIDNVFKEAVAEYGNVLKKLAE
ncbi:MAG: hypothetical protein ABIP79_06035 [Chitinophagaceae bacterium]